jgi:hypothetical protein
MPRLKTNLSGYAQAVPTEGFEIERVEGEMARLRRRRRAERPKRSPRAFTERVLAIVHAQHKRLGGGPLRPAGRA